MKVSIQRSDLIEPFGLAVSVAPSRSPRPILQHVLMTADGAGVELLASDAEMTIRCRVAADVVSPGAVLIPGSIVSQTLRELPDGPITFEGDGDGNLRISSGRSKYTLGAAAVDDFPKLSDPPGDPTCVLSAETLATAIRQTVFAVCDETTRYALNGLLFDFSGGRLDVVATDGRRLAVRNVMMDRDCALDAKPIVPAKAINMVAKVIEAADVALSFAPNSVLFRAGAITVSSRLVEGRYPDWRKAVPQSPHASIGMDASALLAAVRQAQITASVESRGVRMSFANGVAMLSAKSSGLGESEVTFPVGYDGAEIVGTYDPRYLVDVLRVLPEGAAVTMGFHDSGQVVISVDEYRYVLMGME